jgi:hypothetical protein
MSSLANLRKALCKTIEDHLTQEVNYYQNVPDLIQAPAILIEPHMSKFDGAMARGDDMWRFSVYLVVNRLDSDSSQELLDEMLESAGPNSVREAIFNNPTLGLPDTEAFVSGMHEYGGGYRAGRVDVMGAILRVDVHTDGRTL